MVVCIFLNNCNLWSEFQRLSILLPLQGWCWNSRHPQVKADALSFNTFHICQKALEHGPHCLFNNRMVCYCKAGRAAVLTKLVVSHDSVLSIIIKSNIVNKQLIETLVTCKGVLAVIRFDSVSSLQPSDLWLWMDCNCHSISYIFTNVCCTVVQRQCKLRRPLKKFRFINSPPQFLNCASQVVLTMRSYTFHKYLCIGILLSLLINNFASV